MADYQLGKNDAFTVAYGCCVNVVYVFWGGRVLQNAMKKSTPKT